MNMARKKFEELVVEAMEAVPTKLLERLKNVAIAVEEEPSPEQRRLIDLREGEDLYGLYEGLPLIERGEDYAFVLPDKITIFMNATLADAENEDDARRIVRDTIRHEIAHYFGYGESEAEKRELGDHPA